MGSVLVVKILNNHQADRIRLNGNDGPEKGLISSNEPRTPQQSWFMGKKSLSRHAARTSTGAPLPICCDLMAPTSNTRWSRRLVPVVSEVCTGGYGAGRFRDSSARGAERLVGCSAAGAGVRVGEETLLERVENRPAIRLFYDRCASTTALA